MPLKNPTVIINIVGFFALNLISDKRMCYNNNDN